MLNFPYFSSHWKKSQFILFGIESLAWLVIWWPIIHRPVVTWIPDSRKSNTSPIPPALFVSVVLMVVDALYEIIMNSLISLITGHVSDAFYLTCLIWWRMDRRARPDSQLMAAILKRMHKRGMRDYLFAFLCHFGHRVMHVSSVTQNSTEDGRPCIRFSYVSYNNLTSCFSIKRTVFNIRSLKLNSKTNKQKHNN